LKKCSRCKQEKSESEFYNCSRNKDGLRNECKECKSIDQKIYREKKRPKKDVLPNHLKRCFGCKEIKDRSEFTQKRTQLDGLCTYCKSCKKLMSQQSYQRNKEKINEKSRKYHKINYSNTKIKRKKYFQKYRKSNSDKIRIWSINRRAKKSKAEGTLTQHEWQSICKYYNYKCLCCKQKKKLTIDHIVPLNKNGTH